MFCPLIKEECRKEACQWYSTTYEESCIMNAIENHLDNITNILATNDLEKHMVKE